MGRMRAFVGVRVGREELETVEVEHEVEVDVMDTHAAGGVVDAGDTGGVQQGAEAGSLCRGELVRRLCHLRRILHVAKRFRQLQRMPQRCVHRTRRH